MQVTLLDPKVDVRPEFIVGDPDRLKGVLLNLYSNAAKFTRSGFICLRVRMCDLTMLKGKQLINPITSYFNCFEGMRKHVAEKEAEGISAAPVFVSSAGDMQTWWHAYVWPSSTVCSGVTNELLETTGSYEGSTPPPARSTPIRARVVNEVSGSSRAASGDDMCRHVDWQEWHAVGSQVRRSVAV